MLDKVRNMALIADARMPFKGAVHLAAGGESPSLRGARQVYRQFGRWKSEGLEGRELILLEADRIRSIVASVTDAKTSWVGFPLNVASGMTLLAQSMRLHPTDSILIPGGEFPSVIYPWAGTYPGQVVVTEACETADEEYDRMCALAGENTRVIAISVVSYFDGLRRDIARYRELADRTGAWLVVDASHALGSVRVSAHDVDFLFSTSYKWQLGIHGCAIAIWNMSRQPAWTVRAAGWASAVHEERTLRGVSAHQVVPDGRRFELGNASFLSVHLLGLGLETLQGIGIDTIEKHNLHLSGMLISGLRELGVRSVTPSDPVHRAGNVALITDEDAAWARYLGSVGVITWAGQGRLRLSTHAYNSEQDVAVALEVLEEGLRAGLSFS